MKTFAKILGFLLMCMMIFVLVFLYATKPSSNRIGQDKLGRRTNENKDQIRKTNVFNEKEKINILVLGATSTSTLAHPDSKERGQSDTIMLVTLDNEHKKAQILSIPRDSWVQIPKVGERKINDAYSIGDVPLAVKTVENFMDTYIDHYVVVNYDMIAGLVDAMGGVDINWEHNEYHYKDDWIYPPLKIDLYPGINHLDGQGAVAYLRARKAYRDSDLGRINAQQNFLMKVFSDLKKPSTILMVPKLLDLADQYVESDMTYGEIAYLAYWGLNLERKDINTDKVMGEFEDRLQSGVEVNVIIPYRSQARKKLQDFPENLLQKDPTVTMQVYTVGK